MNNHSDLKSITDFLKTAKSLISSGYYDFVPRTKNIRSIAQLGFTISDVKDTLMDLVPSDYYSGPDTDRDREGMVWVFKKNIDGLKIYIKLKIRQGGSRTDLVCISFHVDE